MPSFAPPLHLASFAANSSSALKLAQVHNRKPNKAAELALAVDGEGLWRYDVETLHPTWSFTVPPTTTFPTAPLTLVLPSSPSSSSSSSIAERIITLASASSDAGTSSELWAFRNDAAEKDVVSLPSKSSSVVDLFALPISSSSSSTVVPEAERGPWALVALSSSPTAAKGGAAAKGKSRSYAALALSPSAAAAAPLALSPLSRPASPAPPSAPLIHASVHLASLFPSLRPSSGASSSVLLEVYASGDVQLSAIVLPTTAATAGVAARKGALEMVRQAGQAEGWEEGEKAVEVALVEGAETGGGALVILTDRAHLHTISLATLAPLSAPLALRTPPPHALAPLGPYALLLTPSQLHLLSPTYASIVASPALPSTTFTLARALALGKVALVGRKADKWGVWVGEVGLDRASGGVGEVMFTKDQTAKVLGPLHPTAAAAASTTPSEETPTSGNVAAAVNRTSSVGRTKHFGRLLQAADWEAVLQLVSDPSYAAGLPASSLTSLLSAVLDLPAPPPTLSKGKHAGSSVTAELVLGKLTATGLVRADDGEWRAAIGSLELEHVVVVLELLGRWVAMLADVEKEAQWTEVGKGLPTLAEIVPLLTLMLDTHLSSLLSHPSAPTSLALLSTSLKPHVKTQRTLCSAGGLLDGARRVLRASERARVRDRKSGAAGGAGGGGGGRRRGGKGAVKSEWQGLYRLEEFVL